MLSAYILERRSNRNAKLEKIVPLAVGGQRHWSIVCGDKLGLSTSRNLFI